MTSQPPLGPTGSLACSYGSGTQALPSHTAVVTALIQRRPGELRPGEQRRPRRARPPVRGAEIMGADGVWTGRYLPAETSGLASYRNRLSYEADNLFINREVPEAQIENQASITLEEVRRRSKTSPGGLDPQAV